MRLMTWLPSELREQIAALDAATEASTPRPELADILARAESVDAQPDRVPPVDLDDLDPAPGARGRRRRVLVAVGCAVVLVAGLAIGLTGLHPSRNQPTASHPTPVATQRAAPSVTALYGVTWTDTASRATVVFGPGTAHTSDGCSGQTQALTVSGGALHLGRQIGSAYTCGGPPAPMPGNPGYSAWTKQQAALDRFDKVLDSAPQWSLAGDILTLTAPDGVSIALTTKGSAPLSLPGSSWALATAFVMAGRVGSAYTASGQTLSFDRGGGFRATDSCHDVLSGTATVSASAVTFTVQRRIEGSCTASRTDPVDTAVETMLKGPITYEVEDNTLRLTRSADRDELVYTPAPGD